MIVRTSVAARSLWLAFSIALAGCGSSSSTGGSGGTSGHMGGAPGTVGGKSGGTGGLAGSTGTGGSTSTGSSGGSTGSSGGSTGSSGGSTGSSGGSTGSSGGSTGAAGGGSGGSGVVGGAGGGPAGVGAEPRGGNGGTFGGQGGGAGASSSSAGGFAGAASGSGGAPSGGGTGGTSVTGTAGAGGTGGQSSTATGGSPGTGGSACVPGTAGWVYIMSCDFTVGGLLHQCIDYYGTPLSAISIGISSRGVCGAMTGSVLTTPCTTTNSLGSCITTGSEGAVATSPQAEYLRQYQYAAAGITADSWRASCMTTASTFVPAGSSPTVGVPALVCPSGGSVGSSSAGQLAFAVATLLNGQVVQCTNFVGAATGAQRQSIVSIGGMLTPCPTQNAICACPRPPGSGTFGTDATAITYTTSFGPQTGCGTSVGPGCSTSYTPPPVP